MKKLLVLPLFVFLGSCQSDTELPNADGKSDVSHLADSGVEDLCKCQDGLDGINGVDGLDGLDGLNGKDGVKGSNGIDGTNGLDGLPGNDGISGLSSLVALFQVEPGEDCEFGGIELRTGFDLNNNLELDLEETDDALFLCSQGCEKCDEEKSCEHGNHHIHDHNGHHNHRHDD